jgi:hypothetical protein
MVTGKEVQLPLVPKQYALTAYGETGGKSSHLLNVSTR